MEKGESIISKKYIFSRFTALFFCLSSAIHRKIGGLKEGTRHLLNSIMARSITKIYIDLNGNP